MCQSNTPTPSFCSPSSKVSKNKTKKSNSTFAGIAIALSICNKPFKPLGVPSRTSVVLVRVYSKDTHKLHDRMTRSRNKEKQNNDKRK